MDVPVTLPIPVPYTPVVVRPVYRPRYFRPVILFALTLLTTMVVGARLEYNFARSAPAYATNTDVVPFLWIFRHPHLLWLGLPFSTALIGILLAHELGHYIACRYYRIDATLPHFLPAPWMIGTFGAFIRIRSGFRDRRELFDVGVAGPIAGMVVALPLLVIGLLQSHPATFATRQSVFQFGWPPLMAFVARLLHSGATPDALELSPVARAAWVGLLATMLNLIPAGQLDGGHILYTFFPRLHRLISILMIPVLLGLGYFYKTGAWYLWAFIVLLMRARHPAVPNAGRLGATRVLLGIVALLLLAGTFMAEPFIDKQQSNTDADRQTTVMFSAPSVSSCERPLTL